MALPRGPDQQISMNDLQAEFGGSTSNIDLFDYYRNGANVPDNPGNANVPTSGEISLQDFYGSDNNVSLLNRTVTHNAANAIAGIRFNANGEMFQIVGIGAITNTGEWYVPITGAIGADYDVNILRLEAIPPNTSWFDALGGDTVNGVWLQLNVQRNYQLVNDAISPLNSSMQVRARIRERSTLDVVGDATITLNPINT